MPTYRTLTVVCLPLHIFRYAFAYRAFAAVIQHFIRSFVRSSVLPSDQLSWGVVLHSFLPLEVLLLLSPLWQQHRLLIDYPTPPPTASRLSRLWGQLWLRVRLVAQL